MACQHHGTVTGLGSEHGFQVGCQLGVRVAAVRRGGVGFAVAPGVVGELAVSAPGKSVRAMDHVTTRRRDAVEQHDWWAVPDRLTGQTLLTPIDRELRRL